MPSLAQRRQLAHVNLGHPTIGEFCRALRDVRCRRRIVRWTERHFQCRQRVTDSTRLAASTRGKYEIRLTEKTNYEYRTSSVTGHYHQGARRHHMTAAEISTTLRRFWLKLYDPMEVLIMDQGTEFGADFQQMCPEVFCLW